MSRTTRLLITAMHVVLTLLAFHVTTERIALAALNDCSQPVTNGLRPTATDCLFILKVAVGAETYSPECICAPKGTLPVTATDALVCLKYAVAQPVELNCPCAGTTTTTIFAGECRTFEDCTGPGDCECQSGMCTCVTLPTSTSTTLGGGGSTTTTLPALAYSCTIESAGCTETACTCGTDPGIDYHIGASSGTAHGPVGTQLRVNINALQGGQLDCGAWARVNGNVISGCDVIGCCERQDGQPENMTWSVFEVIELPCFCPSNPLAGELKPNMLIQCQLPPGAVIEVEKAATGCP